MIISIGIRWENTYCASLINNKLIIMTERPCGSNCPNKTWAVIATGMIFQVWTYQMIYFLSPRLYSQGRSLILYTVMPKERSLYLFWKYFLKKHFWFVISDALYPTQRVGAVFDLNERITFLYFKSSPLSAKVCLPTSCTTGFSYLWRSLFPQIYLKLPVWSHLVFSLWCYQQKIPHWRLE